MSAAGTPTLCGPQDPRLTGRIGGLTAWARNEPEVMIGPAHRGFRRRFENLVDPERRLSESERTIRADRVRRAWMLALAARSAAVRREKAGRGNDPHRPAEEDRRAVGDP
jgi:hypothetical protein